MNRLKDGLFLEKLWKMYSWKMVTVTITPGLNISPVMNVSRLFYHTINTTFLKLQRHFLMWTGENQLRKLGWRTQRNRGREFSDKIATGSAHHSGTSYWTVCPLILIHQYIFNTWLQHTEVLSEEEWRWSLMACLAQGLTAELSWWAELECRCSNKYLFIYFSSRQALARV